MWSFLYLCSIILETDANTIAGKVATNAADGSVPFSEQVILCTSIAEQSSLSYQHIVSHNFLMHCLFVLLQTISQALATAREHFARSLLKWTTSAFVFHMLQLVWVQVELLYVGPGSYYSSCTEVQFWRTEVIKRDWILLKCYVILFSLAIVMYLTYSGSREK